MPTYRPTCDSSDDNDSKKNTIMEDFLRNLLDDVIKLQINFNMFKSNLDSYNQRMEKINEIKHVLNKIGYHSKEMKAYFEAIE